MAGAEIPAKMVAVLGLPLSPAGEDPGEEGDGDQRHGTDLLHGFADALIDEAETVAARGEGGGLGAFRLPAR